MYAVTYTKQRFDGGNSMVYALGNLASGGQMAAAYLPVEDIPAVFSSCVRLDEAGFFRQLADGVPVYLH